MMSVTTFASCKTSSIKRKMENMLHVLPHTRHLHVHSVHLLGEVTHVKPGPLDRVKMSLSDLINGDLYLLLLPLNIPK